MPVLAPITMNTTRSETDAAMALQSMVMVMVLHQPSEHTVLTLGFRQGRALVLAREDQGIRTGGSPAMVLRTSWNQYLLTMSNTVGCDCTDMLGTVLMSIFQAMPNNDQNVPLTDYNV